MVSRLEKKGVLTSKWEDFTGDNIEELIIRNT